MSTVSSNLNIIIPDSDPSSEEENGLPSEIVARVNKLKDNLLPEKSKPKYEAAYERFNKWMKEKKVSKICEDVVLAYFQEFAENYKPSTSWATYSMLRSTIESHHNINIFKYAALIQFLKKNSKGFTPKKASVLSPNQVKQFILEAPDDKYLAVKVN